MGCCGSGLDEKQANKGIDDMLDEVEQQNIKTYKLLLLGAGESGKSTILKQITNEHVEAPSEEMLELIIPKLHKNLIENLQSLIKTANKLYSNDNINECKISENNVSTSSTILKLNTSETKFDKELLKIFKTLLNDDGILYTLNNHSHECIGLSDNASELFNRMERYSDNDFLPAFSDYLFVRSRTVGVNKISCNFCNNKGEIEEKFVVYDVGGQRSERRKWADLFDDVKAVIFVAALSSFNQVIFEDENTNRMVEALNLFENYININAFDKDEIKIVLFLNKNDLFEDKINNKKCMFKDYFNEYKGDNKCQPIRQYITNQFIKRDKAQNRKSQIKIHITTATNGNNINKVFREVRKWVVMGNLVQVGFM